MSAERTYINAAQQRVLRILVMLAGHEISGLAPGEIAGAVRTSGSVITRDMRNLSEAGLAEKMESGRWRITPLMGQLSLRVLRAMDAARDQLDETAKRYSRDR